MLNRKLTNYLFYIIVLAVLAVIYLVRMIMLGDMQGKIDELDADNARLQNQIIQLEQTVEENKDADVAYLYELSSSISANFSDTQLLYNTIALCELAGIGEDIDTQRTIDFAKNVTISGPSELKAFASNYSVVEVRVQFTTQDLSLIEDFINVIYDANQLYLLNTIEYDFPEGNEFVAVNITYFVFYQPE
jgi:hypothetical protein